MSLFLSGRVAVRLCVALCGSVSVNQRVSVFVWPCGLWLRVALRGSVWLCVACSVCEGHGVLWSQDMCQTSMLALDEPIRVKHDV